MIAVGRLLQLFDNPIVAMDGLARMRSWRSPIVITLYLGLLGVFGYAVYGVGVQTQAAGHHGTSDTGTVVFGSMAFFQLSLVCLFAPALGAGAISGERERQTLDMLLVSRVSAWGIVVGKLVTSIGYIVLLVMTALPLFATVFLFGGIDAGQFLLTQALTVGTAIALASVSVCVSAAFQRPLAATVTSYGIAFALVIGSFVYGELLTLMIGSSSSGVHPLLFSNPLYALWQVLWSSNSHIPLVRILQLLFMLPGAPAAGGPLVEPWQATLLVEAVVVVLTTWAAVCMVRGRRATRRRPAPAPAPDLEEAEDDFPPTPTLPREGGGSEEEATA